MITVSVTGMDKVLATLKTLSDGDKLADEAVRKTALNSQIDLVKESLSKTPAISGMNTGTTARAWTNPKKIKAAEYEVSNIYKTRGGKYNVVRILDEGHKEIRPSKTFLYIPLNKKAAMKSPGANIPKEFIRGQDYIFARKVRAVEGLNFIAKNIKAAQAELKTRLLDAVKAAIK